MQVSDIHVQSAAAEVAKKNVTEADKKNVAKHVKKASGDSLPHAKKENVAAQVSISANAGKSNSAEALVKARANALPEIREEKVSVSKERMASGYYNTNEFNKELAGLLTVG
jgi:uncharacterized protein with ACT and thioredoxin-like domain